MKCIKFIFLGLFLPSAILSYGQDERKRHYFPVWSFHQKNINIHGLSLGLWSVNSDPRNTYTNGIKLELIGVGILVPLIPKSPIVETDSAFNKLQKEPISERINGLSLSLSGTVCNCLTNGVSAGFMGQINHQVNGISTAFALNFSQKHNGIMISLFNDAYYMNGIQVGFSNNGHHNTGIQIGVFNRSKNLRGIQLGLWNVNQKRKLPLINWNFGLNK